MTRPQRFEGDDGLVSVTVPPAAVAGAWLGLAQLYEQARHSGRLFSPELEDLLRELWAADQANARARHRPARLRARKPCHPSEVRWFTSREVASRIGVTPARVRQMRDEGRFPGAVRQGPAWIFPEHDIEHEEAERGHH